jgi:hypothetical protein
MKWQKLHAAKNQLTVWLPTCLVLPLVAGPAWLAQASQARQEQRRVRRALNAPVGGGLAAAVR